MTFTHKYFEKFIKQAVISRTMEAKHYNSIIWSVPVNQPPILAFRYQYTHGWTVFSKLTSISINSLTKKWFFFIYISAAELYLKQKIYEQEAEV